MKNNSFKLLFILSVISALVLIVLMDNYKAQAEIVSDNILFILSIFFIGLWLLRIFGGIFGIVLMPFLSSNKIKTIKTKKKSKKKAKESDELTFIHLIIFYPILTFGLLVFFGLALNGFNP
tara:strand:- start:205 stop:567 length:363 start_codon:yes stop_codon:yes gene_type:complete